MLKKCKAVFIFVIVFIFIISVTVFAQYEVDKKAKDEDAEFQWPKGIKAAVSLSFDDARLSQVDIGIPVLDKYDVKATFYVSIPSVEKRLEKWKKAAANGHEIGNHSLKHACSGNFDFSRSRAIENYTLDKMESEIDEASRIIEKLLGVKTVTFGYPCGQSFVGRGKNLKSYVPSIAERFIAGRGWRDEWHNSPVFCDLAKVFGMQMDGYDFTYIKGLIEKTAKGGGWLVLAGHEMKPSGTGLTTYTSMLEELCEYANDPANGIWIATVKDVAEYIIEQRKVMEKK